MSDIISLNSIMKFYPSSGIGSGLAHGSGSAKSSGGAEGARGRTGISEKMNAKKNANFKNSNIIEKSMKIRIIWYK